jgi:hypothetical protein
LFLPCTSVSPKMSSSGFPTEVFYAFLVSSLSTTCPPCLMILDFFTLLVFSEEKNSCFFWLSSFLILPLISLSQIQILSSSAPCFKHPQSMFFHQGERPNSR